jgi:Tol biopolymer transport system component
MRGSTLVAQKFDERNLELKGEVIPVAEGVLNDAGFNLAVFSVSKNGVLVYQIGTALAGSKLIIYDRTGKPLRTVGEVTEFFTPHFSPDGKKVAVGTFDAKSRNQDIWIYDIERGIRTRFTFDLAIEFVPLWSPDGKWIVFNSLRKGTMDLYQKPSSGDRTESLLFESHEPKVATDWSRDGKFIIFTSEGKNTRADLWILPYLSENENGDHKPFPLLQTEFNEEDGHFSPDGKWVAYTSDESGQAEVYVRPFPGPGGKWQISTDGGEFPRWRQDGKELYFMNRTEKLLAAEVHLEGSTVTIGKVNPLFNTKPIMAGSVYDVNADGSKFLINTRIDPESSAPITLVINWDLGMEKK